MRKFLAIVVLALAIAAQFAVATITARDILDGLELTDFRNIFLDRVTLNALAAASIGALCGGLVAVAMWRRKAFLLGPMLLPLLWPVALRLGPDTSPLVVVAHHAVLGLSCGAICGSLSLARLSRGVLRAALLCGVSPMGAVRRVMLPLLIPGVLAGLLLAVMGSLLLSFLRAQADAAIEPSLLASIPLPAWELATAAVLVVTAGAGAVVWLVRAR